MTVPERDQNPLKNPALWLLIGLVIRMAYLFEQSAGSPTFYTPVLDELETRREAARILVSGDPGGVPFFKAPLYSWLAAGFMALSEAEWPLWLRCFQHICGVLLIGIAYQSASILSRGRGLAGPVAAALVCFYGPLVRLEDRLVLDFMVVFLQSAMLWCLLRGIASEKEHAFRWIWRAGLLAAVAWLTRPTLLPVMPVLAAVAAWKWPHASTASARAGVFVCLLLPLLISVLGFGQRNAMVSGERNILPWQGGYNFYHANRPGANGRYLVQESFAVSDSGNPTATLMVEAWKEAHPDQDVNYGEVHQWWMNRGWAAFGDDPAGRIGLLLQKAVYLLSDKEIYNFEDYEFAREQSSILPLLPVRAGIVFPLALASLAGLGLMRRRGVWVLMAYAVPLAGCIALFYVSGRFRMPIVPPAIVLAAVGCSLLREVTTRGRVAALVLGLFGLTLAWGDWWGVRSEDFRYRDYARLSSAWWQVGNPEAALRAADNVREAKPDFPELPLLQGLAQFSLGNTNAAVTLLHRSVHVLPGDPVAPFNLGQIYWTKNGDADEALPWFGMSAKRAPNYEDAKWMGARMFIVQGRKDAAFQTIRNGLTTANRNFRFLVTAALYFRADGAKPQEEEMIRQLLESYGPEAITLLEEEWSRMGKPSLR